MNLFYKAPELTWVGHGTELIKTHNLHNPAPLQLQEVWNLAWRPTSTRWDILVFYPPHPKDRVWAQFCNERYLHTQNDLTTATKFDQWLWYIGRAHSFPRATEFRAEPRNLPLSCRRILPFPRNFAELEIWPVISTIVGDILAWWVMTDSSVTHFSRLMSCSLHFWKEKNNFSFYVANIRPICTNRWCRCWRLVRIGL